MVDNFIEHTPIDLARIETIPRVYTRAVNLQDDRLKDVSGPWVFRPYLYWMDVKLTVSPIIPQGMVEYEFGQIHRHDQTTEQFYPQLDISGHQALLTILHPNGFEEMITAGFLLAADVDYYENTGSNGIQRMRFYGMEYLFKQYDISESYATDLINVIGSVYRAYSFNTEDKQAVVGAMQNTANRSLQIRGNKKTTTDSNGVTYHNFTHAKVTGLGVETTPDLWSAWDVLEYWINSESSMLSLTPELPMQGGSSGDSIQYELDVPQEIQDALKEIKNVWPQEGKNLHQFFNDLLPRELGLFWHLKYEPNFDDGADVVKFVVNSLAETTLNYKTFTVPANTNSIDYTAPSGAPASHFARLPVFTIKDSEGYNNIYITGQPAIVMFNLEARSDADAVANNLPFQMRNAWDTAALEPLFNTGPAPGFSATVNDTVRASDAYRSVYREFELSNNWQWIDRRGRTIYLTDTDGSRVLDDLGPTFQNPSPKVTLGGTQYRSTLIGKEFLRELPILSGVDYTVSPPVNNNFSPIGVPQVPTGVLARDNRLTSQLFGQYVWLDKLGEIPFYNQYLSGCHVTCLEGRPAIAIESDNPILLALTHFPFLLTEYLQEMAVFEWDSDLIFVVAMETDYRLEQRLVGDGKIPDTRKVIEVPECHLWYAMPGTAYDADQNGLLTIHPNNEMLRNDAYKLDYVAALSRHWLGTQRYIVSIEVEGTSATPPISAPLGYLIKNLQYQPGAGQPLATVPIGSTVTAVHINMTQQRTTVETDYPTLDGALQTLYGFL